jgi:excisionase family DNA binding protein
MEKLLSEREAAEVLGVTVRALQAWRHKKKGPPYSKVGGLVRYEPDQLRAWLAANRRTEQGAP